MTGYASSAGGQRPEPRRVGRHPVAPPAVRWIVRTLEEAGFETWAVGGAVRDVLVGVASKDWDLATRARPSQVRRLFRRTVPVGIEHGTVGVLARDGTLYEVTTFRQDVETYGRKAKVRFADRLEDDLARRDFTINAVAWHPLRDEFADPFGGVDDLEAGVLRTVGAPAERLREDYLRVLRALRFAGRFRLRIDPPTWTALCAGAAQLGGLSAERVREELMKVLGGDGRPSGALALYAASGVQAALLGELEALVGAERRAGPPNAWTYAALLADFVPRRRPLLRLAALLHGVSAPRAAALLLRLRFSNAQADRVAGLMRVGLNAPDPDAPGAHLRRWLSRGGAEHLSDLARLWVARARLEGALGAEAPVDAVDAWHALRAELRRHPPLTVADLAVDGRDLIGLGLKPGPAFGRILEALLERAIEDPGVDQRKVLEELAEEKTHG